MSALAPRRGCSCLRRLPCALPQRRAGLHVLALLDRAEHHPVTLALEQLKRRVPQAQVTMVTTTDGQHVAGAPLPWDSMGWSAVSPQTEIVLSAHWGRVIEGLDDAAVYDEIIQRCPQLQWLHTMSTGVEHLPLRKLAEQGVTTTHHTGVSDAPLVEFAVAGLLHFTKQLPRVQAAQAERRWERFQHRTLAGETLAIVGFGAIGRAIGRAASDGLGMRVVAVSRRELSPAELRAGGAESCVCIGDADGQGGARGDRLRWALQQADHVALALPHTSSTTGLIGAEELAVLKEGATLVNVGRGTTIDETALAEALRKRGAGSLSFAGDVFAVEPLPRESELWELPNCLISAHCMDWTADAKALTAEAWVSNVEGYVRAGAPAGLAGVVQPELGY